MGNVSNQVDEPVRLVYNEDYQENYSDKCGTCGHSRASHLNIQSDGQPTLNVLSVRGCRIEVCGTGHEKCSGQKDCSVIQCKCVVFT